MYKVNSRGKRRGNQIWTIKRHKKKRNKTQTEDHKTKNLKDERHGPYEKPECESRCSGRVSKHSLFLKILK